MSLKETFSAFYWTVPSHDRRLNFLEELKRYRIKSWKKMFYDNDYQIIEISKIRDDAVAGFSCKRYD